MSIWRNSNRIEYMALGSRPPTETLTTGNIRLERENKFRWCNFVFLLIKRRRIFGILPSVFGDNHLVGELLKFAPQIPFFQGYAALSIDAGIARIVFNVAAVTDHGRESSFGRRQNVLMSRWVAGHDGVSVLMRVLERRLVHFKAHPWPATTGQVFKSIVRFNDSISSQISQHNRKKNTRQTTRWQHKTKRITPKKEMWNCFKKQNNIFFEWFDKKFTCFFLDGKNIFRCHNKSRHVRRRTWMVEDSWGSCFTQPPFYWLGVVRPRFMGWGCPIGGSRDSTHRPFLIDWLVDIFLFSFTFFFSLSFCPF